MINSLLKKGIIKKVFRMPPNFPLTKLHKFDWHAKERKQKQQHIEQISKQARRSW